MEVRSHRPEVGGQSFTLTILLRSVSFVIKLWVPIGTAKVASRVRSLFFAVTVRSVIVIIANPAAASQSIQDQTGGANS